MTHLNPIVTHRLEAFVAPPTIAPPPSRMIKNKQRCDYVMTLRSDYFTEVASLLALRLKGETALTRMEQSVYKEISYTTNHKRIGIRQTHFMSLKSSDNRANKEHLGGGHACLLATFKKCFN